MKYKAKKTTCACGNPERRPNGLCKACNAEAGRTYRAKIKAMRAEVDGSPYAEAVRKAKMRILLGAIREERGNLTAAGLRLGVHRNTINRVMKEIGLTAQQVKQYIREDAPRKAAA
jgi:DNA-binding NtrC family response regulator